MVWAAGVEISDELLIAAWHSDKSARAICFELGISDLHKRAENKLYRAWDILKRDGRIPSQSRYHRMSEAQVAQAQFAYEEQQRQRLHDRIAKRDAGDEDPERNETRLIGATDMLLEQLILVHGPDGRADIPAALVPTIKKPVVAHR